MGHTFQILNVAAFQICRWFFCDLILSKVIEIFVDLGEIIQSGF